MNILLSLLMAAIAGYLAGAFPFGFLYVKLVKGIDLRQVGSGRTGGTNSMRAAGFWVGFVTSLSDVLKGAVGVWLARWLLQLFGSPLSDTALPWAEVLAGVFAVVGHNWSVFLGWRGGAGTGPNIGWASAIWWPMFPLGLLIMPLFMILTGMASVASLVMGLSIPLIFALRFALGFDPSLAYTLGGLVTFGVVAWALRPNIRRIFNGTERLVGPRAWRKARQRRTEVEASS